MLGAIGCSHEYLRRCSGTMLADISALLWSCAETFDQELVGEASTRILAVAWVTGHVEYYGCTHEYLRRRSDTILADISALLWGSAETIDWSLKLGWTKLDTNCGRGSGNGQC